MNVATPPLVVRELTPETASAWDAFVDGCPEATFFHRAGWREVIERSFGHRTHFLYAESGGQLRGVLPLTHIRSRLFGNALISPAFGVYGGPAVSDEAARRALDERAAVVADALAVDYLEYRSRQPLRDAWQRRSDLYATFRREITGDPERDLKAIPRKQRAVVRKSLEAGLEARLHDAAGPVHRVYAESVRNLGTPVFPKVYFRTLKRVFGDDCELMTVEAGGKLQSALLSFYFRDEVLPYYGGGVPAARRSGANDFMYWNLMCRAGQRGCRIFDFGRSKQGTGAYAFKKNWGFTPAPLHYEYRLRSGSVLPDNNPLNPKYRLFIAAWRRLPLPIANLAGPYIVRNLG